MDLWTEFEGVTIDKAFALSKLLQTEGRSAFFSTRNANGEPVLIRIIECHFDEDEILARWRGVQTMGHPSFLRIEHFGQFLIEADDITAVYAVFERVDANLGEVLQQGRLPIEDAAQIGLSIASAVEMLHANGFVHEHIEAGNIYAVGDTVKLRSDCIRETPEGERGLAARRRDVHDLVVVLMQVLLGNPRAAEAPRSGTLVARFEEIVRKGMSGDWGLKEIQAALSPYKPGNTAVQRPSAAKPVSAATTTPQPKPQPIAAKSENTPVNGAPKPALPATSSVSNPTMKSAAPEKLPEPETKGQAGFRPKAETWAAPSRAGKPASAERKVFPAAERPLFDLQAWLTAIERDRRKWMAGGALLLVVLILGWMFAHRFSGRTVNAEPAAAAGTSEAPSHAPVAPARTVTPHASARTSSVVPTVANGKQQWRVVAFTYNREDQARKKAATVGQKHPDLRAEAFSPSGRAPWLVTVGGAMDRDSAYALARKARSLGLPRDTYAQNYSGR